MHHKRGRPKNQRGGCLLCKPWKMNGAKNDSHGHGYGLVKTCSVSNARRLQDVIPNLIDEMYEDMKQTLYWEEQQELIGEPMTCYV